MVGGVARGGADGVGVGAGVGVVIGLLPHANTTISSNMPRLRLAIRTVPDHSPLQ